MKFSPPTSQTSANVPSHKKQNRAANFCQRRSVTCHVGRVDVAPRRNETPPHVVRLCRTRSQTLGFRVWLGFGVAVLGLFRCFGSVGLAEFWRRAGAGLQPKSRIHSFGVSACQRHHHVAKDICVRLLRNGCTPPQPGKNNVFEFVPRNTMHVVSVMKVRGGRLSVRSCHHQRGRVMSTALIVPRTLRFLGGSSVQRH